MKTLYLWFPGFTVFIFCFSCDVNITDLITVEDVMTHLNLGPNGGLIYCMEHLEKNIDWLKERLSPFKDSYLIFDFPGQVRV